VAAKVGLFIVVVACWGGNDVVSTVLGRGLPTFIVALSSLFGQLTVAACFGFAAFVRGDFGAAAAAGAPGASSSHFGWAHAQMMGASMAAIIAWLSFVALGRHGQASVFVPIVALYVYLPVALSMALLGETLSAGKLVGCLLAGAAVVLMSLSWKGARTVAGAGGAAAAGASASGAASATAAGNAAADEEQIQLHSDSTLVPGQAV
jgi:drug/metabolite transporter (DMT)-like permease